MSAHLAGEPTSPARARRLVADALSEWHCDHLADEALLLTSELVTNAVLHGGSEVDVTVSNRGATVRVEVSDDDAGSVAPVAPSLFSTSGRGLGLVAALSLAWGVSPRRAGKSVWFELAR